MSILFRTFAVEKEIIITRSCARHEQRVNSMKKENKNGRITITSDRNEKFINMNTAILAAQMLQQNMTQQGYLTTSRFDPENEIIEVTVHFGGKAFPTLFTGYKSTYHEVKSSQYWSEVLKKTVTVRVLTFHFEY